MQVSAFRAECAYLPFQVGTLSIEFGLVLGLWLRLWLARVHEEFVLVEAAVRVAAFGSRWMLRRRRARSSIRIKTQMRVILDKLSLSRKTDPYGQYQEKLC